MRCAVFMGEHQSGTAGALDDAGGEDADDSAMPTGGVGAMVIEDHAGGEAIGRGEQCLDLLLYFT